MKKYTTVDLLRTFMKHHSMTQYKLAGILGCPHPTLSRWLLGKCKPSPAWEYLIMEKIKKENSKLIIDK